MVKWVPLVAIFYLLPALAFGQSNEDEDTKSIIKEIDPVDYEDNEDFGQSNEDEDTKLINNQIDPVDYKAFDQSNEDKDSKFINNDKDPVDYEDFGQSNEGEDTKLINIEKDSVDNEDNGQSNEDENTKIKNKDPPPPLPSLRRALKGGHSIEYVYPGSEEEPKCSGKKCKALGGKCVKKLKHKCMDDVCGSRYYLSPCPCDTTTCCCMPVTCPAPESKEAKKCTDAGGVCHYRDEKCDGECLPLCGPSCSCCLGGCSRLGAQCGEFGEGKCRLECEGGEQIDELGKCQGPKCVCCSPYTHEEPCFLDEPCQRKENSSKGAYGRGASISMIGIHRENCANDESVIAYISPKCRCCIRNACPKAGKLCNDGTGMCKRKCGIDEIVVTEGNINCGGQSDTCACCVVQACASPGEGCLGTKGREGKCAATCPEGEEPIGVCPGHIGQCKCCAPKICTAVGGRCGEDGTGICKEKCDIMEIESLKCDGMDCKCCMSPLCLEPNKKCSNDIGVCKEQCDPHSEQANGACDGKCCYCCVKKKCLNDWQTCKANIRYGVTSTGVCKVKCEDDEKQVKGGQCMGPDCSCCLPTLCVDVGESCGIDNKGYCNEVCNMDTEAVDLSGTCNGIACHCCKEKDCHNEGALCLDGEGFCRPHCLHDETASEDRQACKGGSCKCCRPQDCVQIGATCGYGMVGTCKLNCNPLMEDDVGRCEGRKCRCCRERDCRNFGCACGGKLNGVCKSRCDDNEESIAVCEGRNCKCCTKKACKSFGTPCGGSLNGQCKPRCLGLIGETEVGTCPGSDCKCCKKQSCDAQGGSCGQSGKGRCRTKCYPSEETVGMCSKGTNLFCCQLRTCADPGSCCNHDKNGETISGTCRPECSLHEEMIAPCNGTDCKCCSPKKCDSLGFACGQMTTGPGICKDKCGPDDEIIGKCSGTHCKCCSHKVCTKKGSPCGQMNRGKCMEKCRANEEEIGTCDGANCKCCAIKACVRYGGPCGKRGTCRDKCLVTEEPMSQCKGSHCICCEPKVCKDPGAGGCSSKGGVCRMNCTTANLAPNPKLGACGFQCKCCLCKNKETDTKLVIEKICPREKCGRSKSGSCKTVCSANERMERTRDCIVNDGDGYNTLSQPCVCCVPEEYVPYGDSEFPRGRDLGLDLPELPSSRHGMRKSRPLLGYLQYDEYNIQHPMFTQDGVGHPEGDYSPELHDYFYDYKVVGPKVKKFQYN